MPANVSYDDLVKNYPKPRNISHDQLFDDLGWGSIKGNPVYKNTCAIRMSLCLLRSGVHVAGRIPIKAGPQKGKWIEPGQVRLTNQLAGEKLFGRPRKFKIPERDKVLKNQRGIVSFMKIPGYTIDGALSGHIDLVEYGTFLYFFETYTCASHCYWNANECWFWSLR